MGRTARLGQEGEAILFLQPCELDYLNVLQTHGVTLKELPLGKLLDVLPTDRKRKQSQDLAAAVEAHPVASYMHLALETFVSKASTCHLLDTPFSATLYHLCFVTNVTITKWAHLACLTSTGTDVLLLPLPNP